jgi:hypothetical protein
MRGTAALAAISAAAMLGLSACTSTDGATPARVSWSRVALPAGMTPVTLAIAGGNVLVGAFSAGRPHPRLLVGTAADGLRDVALTPKSPYAFEARWLSVAVHDDTVFAVGGARGGAHANVRWTTWSGTTAHLSENEQPFGTFGGWGAGDLSGLAFAGTDPVILGSWASDSTGLDVSTWLFAHDRWKRQSSTGTPLGSTPRDLLSARALSSAGSGLVASGSVTSLGDGDISTHPAIWRAPAAGGPWTRVALPAAESPSDAHAATCSGTYCLVVGQQAGRLTLWDVVDTSAHLVAGMPAPRVPERRYALPPLRVGGKDVIVVPAEGHTTVVVRDGTSWSQRRGPDGIPVSAVVLGTEVWLVTDDGDGTGNLWRARP